MSNKDNPSWWQALNPAIYLVSILPGISVWLLLQPRGGPAIALALATVAVVLLQHAINLLNDVSDWRLGADAEKWDSWVRVHREDLKVAQTHGWTSFLAGGLLGLAALAYVDRLWILLIALPLVVLGYRYNSGQRPLSYTHLGEWVTGLCYGPGVVGCLWLLLGRSIDATAVLAMGAFAALSVALLLSHQPPQIATDRDAGKQSFAVRYGAARTYRVSRSLYGVFLVTSAAVLWRVGAGVTTLTIYGAIATWTLYQIFQTGLGPKRILISASSIVVAMAVVRYLGYWV